MPIKVVVIGGSVGGVSTAVALRKVGCDVVVLERAAAIVATTGAVSAKPQQSLSLLPTKSSHQLMVNFGL